MFRRSLRSLVVLPVILLLCATHASAAEMPSYGISWIRELGFNPLLVPRRPQQHSAPLAAPEGVFLGTRLGDVWSFDRQRGAVRWKTSLGSPIDANLTLDEARLYAGTISGAVHALSRADGATLWRYWAGHEVQGAPTIAGNLLLFTTANNQVFALERETGAWRWQYSEGRDPDLSIRGVAGVVTTDDAAFTGFSNGVVVRLNLADGNVAWRQALEGGRQFQDVDGTPVLADGRLYVVVYGSRLVAMNPEDGSVLWSSAVSSHNSATVVEGRVYLGGTNGSLYAFDAVTGDPVWSRSISSEPLSTPTYHGGRLYVADGSRGMAVVNAVDGSPVWRYKGAVSGTRTPPAVDARGGIYLSSNLGHLYRFHPVRSR